jgi:hypothetical protein
VLLQLGIEAFLLEEAPLVGYVDRRVAGGVDAARDAGVEDQRQRLIARRPLPPADDAAAQVVARAVL